MNEADIKWDMQAKLHSALAKAQGKFGPIEKNRSVVIRSDKGAYSFEYADLEEMIAKTRPALSENGLAVVQSVGCDPSGAMYLDTVLLHADGGSLHSRVPMVGIKELGDPKKLGALITYLRRYQYAAMLCIAADDDLDDDGEGIDDEPRQQGRRAELREERKRPEPDGGATASASEIAWVKKKIESLKLDPMAILGPHGVKTYDTMTRDQFAAVKAELVKR